jgi:hypothetical protein
MIPRLPVLFTRSGCLGAAMLALDKKWAKVLMSQPETGMGYRIVSVLLKDGRRFERVMIVGGMITSINGNPDVPFAESEIEDIR